MIGSYLAVGKILSKDFRKRSILLMNKDKYDLNCAPKKYFKNMKG